MLRDNNILEIYSKCKMLLKYLNEVNYLHSSSLYNERFTAIRNKATILEMAIVYNIMIYFEKSSIYIGSEKKKF